MEQEEVEEARLEVEEQEVLVELVVAKEVLAWVFRLVVSKKEDHGFEGMAAGEAAAVEPMMVLVLGAWMAGTAKP